MKEFEIKTKVVEMDIDELPEDQKSLVQRARRATYRSYSPYSHFCVGAAISLSNGETITGSNQENVAYPSGTCAERTACYYAHSRHPEAKFQAIAIAARQEDGQFTTWPIPPCGACRQALLEYEKLAGEPVKVILAGRDKVYVLDSIQSLLPFAFTEF